MGGDNINSVAPEEEVTKSKVDDTKNTLPTDKLENGPV